MLKNYKLVIFIVIAILLVIFFINKWGEDKTVEPTLPEETETMTQIALYFAQENSLELAKEYRYVKLSAIRENMPLTIMNELLNGPTFEGYKNTIPSGTKVNDVVKNGNSITIDLSKEFIENHVGDSVAQALTIYSIVNSLTEITEVDSVKFLIDGQEVEKFRDNFKFNEPFTRSKI